MGTTAARPGDYQEPELPEGVMEVRLSVYKLVFTGWTVFDSVGAGVAGTYHSGVVVGGEEWAFGGHMEEGQTGVYWVDPEMNKDFTFYQRIVIGQRRLSPTEAKREIRRLASCPAWSGPKYDLLEHNCNHFTSELCWQLMRKRPPGWINDSAEQFALVRRQKREQGRALARALSEFRSQHAALSSGRPTQELSNVPGEAAFEDGFKTTFDLVCRRSREESRHLAGDGAEGEDPEELRRILEESTFASAARAAGVVATAVGAAARAAAAARSAQQKAGLEAWDEVWRKKSRVLLREWQDEAVAGALRHAGDQAVPSFAYQVAEAARAQQARAQQVEAVLAVAATAAEAAAEVAVANAARLAAADPGAPSSAASAAP